jgi:hypothetical protein
MGPDLLQKMEQHVIKTVLCNKDDNLKPILQFWPGGHDENAWQTTMD